MCASTSSLSRLRLVLLSVSAAASTADCSQLFMVKQHFSFFFVFFCLPQHKAFVWKPLAQHSFNSLQNATTLQLAIQLSFNAYNLWQAQLVGCTKIFHSHSCMYECLLHTYIYVHVYISMCILVCVCVTSKQCVQYNSLDAKRLTCLQFMTFSLQPMGMCRHTHELEYMYYYIYV